MLRSTCTTTRIVRQILALERSSKIRSFASSSRTMDKDIFRIHELLAKFKDPTSHYHIPPGTSGPVDENDHSTSRAPRPHPLADYPSGPSSSAPSGSSSPSLSPASPSQTAENKPKGRQQGHEEAAANDYASSRLSAKEWFGKEGYDTEGMMEVNVVWGEQDTFRHVNNVHFVRWIESARIHYCENFSELPKGMLRNMLTGKGTGFILKDVSVKYKSPVTYPDTVLIASRIHDINQPRAYFKMGHAIWSLKENKLAATGDSTLVMYDYDNLRKGTMRDDFKAALEARHRP